jgi:hypothetical protein
MQEEAFLAELTNDVVAVAFVAENWTNVTEALTGDVENR